MFILDITLLETPKTSFSKRASAMDGHVRFREKYVHSLNSRTSSSLLVILSSGNSSNRENLEEPGDPPTFPIVEGELAVGIDSVERTGYISGRHVINAYLNIVTAHVAALSFGDIARSSKGSALRVV